ncbi:major facilitator superfamily domain-containing protein [Cladorrhinum sp. PSN332]|nr:major facilitator superfamily domain-containing protein [Cladorrhinum sp. PSN332]
MSSKTSVSPSKELPNDTEYGSGSATGGDVSPSPASVLTSSSPPPDGGLLAWLQVLGAFFLNFNTWGLLNTFGLFQASYSSTHPSWSPSQISWIGSLQAFLMLFSCVLSGRLLDSGFFHPTLITGIILSVLGMHLTSISTQYYHFLLSQSICVGIGLGMTFIPSITLVGSYFTSRRSTAMGLAATGSSVGGIIYPILLNHLISSIGLPWATRCLAFTMMGTLLIPLAIMRPLKSFTPDNKQKQQQQQQQPPRKPLLTKPSPVFSLWLLAIFFTFTGLYIPFFYIETISQSIPGVVSQNLEPFHLLIILNASSIPGRILPPILADRLGRLDNLTTIMIPSVLLSGIITLTWIKAATITAATATTTTTTTTTTTQAGIVSVSVLLGLTSGSIQAVLPAQVPHLCPDMSMLGTNMGMTMLASGLGLLVGSPVAGVILNKQSQGESTNTKTGKLQQQQQREEEVIPVYWGMLTFAGVAVILGGLLLVVVRFMKMKKQG